MDLTPKPSTPWWSLLGCCRPPSASSSYEEEEEKDPYLYLEIEEDTTPNTNASIVSSLKVLTESEAVVDENEKSFLDTPTTATGTEGSGE